MKLSPWLRFAAFFWLACVAWFVLLVAGVLANSAHAETRIDEREPPPLPGPAPPQHRRH